MRKKNNRKQANLQGRRMPTTNYYRPKSNPIEISNTDKGRGVENVDSSKKRFTISKLVNYLILAATLILVVYATTLSTNPDVIMQKDNYTYRDKSEYEKVASDLLSESLIDRSKLLFRSTQFESEMVESFPEISNIEALIPIGGRDLTVAITVSEPLAVIKNGQQIGLINDSGTLIAYSAVDDAGLVNLRFTTPQDNFENGVRILTEQEIKILQLLEKELSQLSLKNYESLTVNEILFNVLNGQFEVHLNEAPFYIKISTYADAEEQIGAFVATVKQLDREGSLPKEYIDVRVPGRVFVL